MADQFKLQHFEIWIDFHDLFIVKSLIAVVGFCRLTNFLIKFLFLCLQIMVKETKFYDLLGSKPSAIFDCLCFFFIAKSLIAVVGFCRLKNFLIMF